MKTKQKNSNQKVVVTKLESVPKITRAVYPELDWYEDKLPQNNKKQTVALILSR